MDCLSDYQIIWYGSFDSTGYGNVSTNSVLHLHKAGIDVKIVPIYGAIKCKLNIEDEEILKSLISKGISETKNKIAVFHIQPDTYPKVKDKLFDKQIGFTVWETDKIPSDWVDSCNRMDAMIVPSKINKEVFESCGVKVPIYIARHGIDKEVFHAIGDSFDFACEMPKFKFLSVCTFQYRKGLDILLKAFWEEFTSQNDVCLVIKTSKTNNLKQIITDYRDSLNVKDYAPVYVSSEDFTNEQMASIYRASDCFVLSSRGEGVGLPYLEAGACGLPVIASNWGGQRDLLNKSNSYLLDGKLDYIDETAAQFPNFKAYMKWFHPDVYHLRALMRTAFEREKEIKKKAEKLYQEIHNNWKWTYTVVDLIKILDTVNEG